MLAALAMSSLLLLATLPPFVTPSWRGVLMQAFAGICHQIAERSPALYGIHLGVCHRCYGVYLGLFIAPFAWLMFASAAQFLRRHARIAVLAASAPVTVDWLLGTLNLWQNTPHSRMITGGIFGFVAGLILTLALSVRRRAAL